MEHAKYRDCRERIESILEKTLTDGGRPVSVAMVDGHGDLLAFDRMDGASPRSVTIALNKAYTAARMGRDTHTFAQRLEENRYHPDWFGDPRFTGLKGGIALKVGEGCVGGIGVAGRSAEEDFELAQRGLANLKKKLTEQP